MNLETGNLAVTDPLSQQEVTVVIRVFPDNAQRPARMALVSVGTSEQPPVFASGILEDVADLIRRAWLAYGARADVRQRNEDMERLADAAVGNEGGEAEISVLALTQAEAQAPPAQSRPRNLSLF